MTVIDSRPGASPPGPLDQPAIDQLVIAGWTGRNAAAIEAHILELEALGMPRPSRTPVFYRASASLLTRSDAIEVLGDDTSGEVEVVVVKRADGLWVGVGSDHTDRALERTSVAHSKQVCPKIVSSELWRADEVSPHWDQLVLRSWAHRGGERKLYQDGTAAAMRPPEELIAGFEADGGRFEVGTAMFCGTLSAIGGIAPADAFEIELRDDVLGRVLHHQYRIVTLPVRS